MPVFASRTKFWYALLTRRVARQARVNFTSHAKIMPREQTVSLDWNFYVGVNEIIRITRPLPWSISNCYVNFWNWLSSIRFDDRKGLFISFSIFLLYISYSLIEMPSFLFDKGYQSWSTFVFNSTWMDYNGFCRSRYFLTFVLSVNWRLMLR